MSAGEVRRAVWLDAVLLLAAALLLTAIWQWTPVHQWLDPDRLSTAAAPLRDAWYGGPLAVLAFVVLGLAFVPLLLLVLLMGMVFGPWLGPLYALVGALATGTIGFALGRRIGRRTVERLVGARARRLRSLLQRNGVLAVFLARKVPLPYTLTNLVLGASGVRLRDFLLGTVIGLGAIVALLAAFGHHLLTARRDPSAASIALAGGVLAVALLLAWAINRGLQRWDRATGTA